MSLWCPSEHKDFVVPIITRLPRVSSIVMECMCQALLVGSNGADVTGIASYALPLVGEVGDFAWVRMTVGVG